MPISIQASLGTLITLLLISAKKFSYVKYKTNTLINLKTLNRRLIETFFKDLINKFYKQLMYFCSLITIYTNLYKCLNLISYGIKKIFLLKLKYTLLVVFEI